MNRTMTSNIEISQRILVTTKELQSLLGAGRVSAMNIGASANARVDVGKRVFWNRNKIEVYLKNIAV